MYRELLTTSSLLALPLVALVTFALVFVAVVFRALTHQRAEIESAARLPLEFEEGRHDR